eukprot:scaffold678456_cov81-Prasinocladus_malaysianus.AAC.1
MFNRLLATWSFANANRCIERTRIYSEPVISETSKCPQLSYHNREQRKKGSGRAVSKAGEGARDRVLKQALGA